MIPYYILSTIPIFFIFGKKENYQNIFLFFFIIFLILFLGLRFEMGTDWYEYSKDYFLQIKNFENNKAENYFKLNAWLDLNLTGLVGHMPFYKLSLLISEYITENIIFFNLLNSFFVVSGTYYYCKIFCAKNSTTWLIFSFLLPFLYFVSTDIVRQFTGLIFVSIGFAFLLNYNKKKFVYFVFIGTFFHITSIMFLSILLFIDQKLRNAFIIFLILSNGISFYYYENIYLFNLFNFYLSDQRLMSYSINVNLLLIIFPIFFIGYLLKKKKFNRLEKKFSSFFIIYGFFCGFISFIDDTASYRLSVYLITFYLFIIIKFSSLLSGNHLYWFKSSLFSFSLFLLVTWLNFSNHAHVYSPYKNVLMLDEKFLNTKTQICAQSKECLFTQ